MFAPGSITSDEDILIEEHNLEDIFHGKEDQVIETELRKQKRGKLLSRRINKHGRDQQLQDENSKSQKNKNLRDWIDQWIKHPFEISELSQLVSAIFSQDRFQQHYGVIGLRKLLSIEGGPPIQEVIDSNIVPRLIDFMGNEYEPHLQLEAAWALTNVASGTTQQTQIVIDQGGIPCFVKLLKCKRVEVAEQAIWAIGNIAGDSAEFRDKILEWGGLEPILNLIKNGATNAIIKHGTWAISNLCRGRPKPNSYFIDVAIPTFAAVIQTEHDAETLTDACWAMSYLSDGDDNQIKKVVDTGIIPSLVKHLDNPFLSILIPALRTLGNIVTGNSEQTDMVLKFPESIEKLYQLLSHQKKAVRREACWTLSNITAGTSDQIEFIIGNPNYVKKLIELTINDSEEVKREACWVLSNATNTSTPEQNQRMFDLGIVNCFIQLLNSADSKTIIIVLEGLKKFLIWGQTLSLNESDKNIIVVELEEKGAAIRMEELLGHQNEEVYSKTLEILETFFELET
jgi:hypothetical protein